MEKQHGDDRQLVAQRGDAVDCDLAHVLKRKAQHIGAKAQVGAGQGKVAQAGNGNKRLRHNGGISGADNSAVEGENENIIKHNVEQQADNGQPHGEHGASVVADDGRNRHHQHAGGVAENENR